MKKEKKKDKRKTKRNINKTCGAVEEEYITGDELAPPVPLPPPAPPPSKLSPSLQSVIPFMKQRVNQVESKAKKKKKKCEKSMKLITRELIDDISKLGFSYEPSSDSDDNCTTRNENFQRVSSKEKIKEMQKNTAEDLDLFSINEDDDCEDTVSKSTVLSAKSVQAIVTKQAAPLSSVIIPPNRLVPLPAFTLAKQTTDIRARFPTPFAVVAHNPHPLFVATSTTRRTTTGPTVHVPLLYSHSPIVFRQQPSTSIMQSVSPRTLPSAHLTPSRPQTYTRVLTHIAGTTGPSPYICAYTPPITSNSYHISYDRKNDSKVFWKKKPLSVTLPPNKPNTIKKTNSSTDEDKSELTLIDVEYLLKFCKDIIDDSEKVKTVECTSEENIFEMNTKPRNVTTLAKNTDNTDFWLRVHTLKSQRDGGILDHDDKLHDVVDDREQLIALYEEANTSVHHVGDGRSSAGTTSPEMIHVSASAVSYERHDKWLPNQNDIVVTTKDINASSVKLRVRRGSEPALNKVGLPPPYPIDKQFSTQANDYPSKANDFPIKHERSGSDDCSAFSRFQRRSLHSNNVNMWKWFEAQEKIEERSMEGSAYLSSSALRVPSDHEETHNDRHEPLGESSSSNSEEKAADTLSMSPPLPQSEPPSRKRTLTLMADGGLLGIHVVPNFDNNKKENGLVIHSIEPNKAVAKDGRLKEKDCILEINGINLYGLPFNRAKDIFKDALRKNSVDLLVESPCLSEEIVSQETKPVSPKKTTPEVPPRNPNTVLTPQKHSLSNTRKIGTEITIQLIKGKDGLGFSVTTRDNPGGGRSPIYVKNILPRGAAITDGKLQKGDRILKVNGIDMTEKTQEEAVNLLKQVRQGSSVDLVVSRQVPLSSTSSDNQQFSLPRQMNSCASPDTEQSPEDHQTPPDEEVGKEEILEFEVASNDTNSAGLGVAVKGKIDDNGHVGLFIKSIIPGGAAFKDSRLKINDQILEVNGHGLKGQTNSEAMDELKNAVKIGGRHSIRVKVRRISNSDVSEDKNNNFAKDDNNGLRNESYYRANYDSLAMDSFLSQEKSNKAHKEALIEERNNVNNPVKPLSDKNNKIVSDDGVFKKPKPSVLPSFADATDAKIKSPEENKQDFIPETPTKIDDLKPFDRDAPGRRSISEKRKGHGDPNSIEFYQKLKHSKKDSDPLAASAPTNLKRVISAECLSSTNTEQLCECKLKAQQVGPTLGLKKSSSLESLQAAVHDATLRDPEQDKKTFKQPKPVSRGRGCNESFRAAVDRSYEPDDLPQLDSLDEETDGGLSSASSQKPINRKRSKERLGLLKVFKFGKSKKNDGESTKQQKKKLQESQQSRQRRGITVDKMVAMKQKYMDEHQSRGGKYPNEEVEPTYLAQSYPARRPAERVERPNLRQPQQPIDFVRANMNTNERMEEEAMKFRQKLPSSKSAQNLQHQINQQRVYDRLAQSQHVPNASDRRSRHHQAYSTSSQPDKAMDLNDLAMPSNIHVFDPLTRSQFDPRTSRFAPPNPYINRQQRSDYGPLEPRVFDPRFPSRPSSTIPSRSSSPPRINGYRSNTPTNSLGYLSHHHRKPPLPPSSNIHELDDPRSVYRPSETIHYGSLGRRPTPRISNSAQTTSSCNIKDLDDTLTKENIDLNEGFENEDNLTLFLAACIGGNHQLIKYTLSKGADIWSMTSFGDNALYLLVHSLCEKEYDTRHIAILEDLKQAGCLIDSPNCEGYTPLHRAAAGGYMYIVDWLLENGADPSILNVHGLQPHEVAYLHGHFQVSGKLKAYTFIRKLQLSLSRRNRLESCESNFNYSNTSFRISEWLDDVNQWNTK
ncbi:DgyrCDS6346 [Dimorphilus gyrociliatus]|uniref:DgyrCDS6346 n=1 Tax=Dimorphilus gyrociliatus TaxID=2664684 RepID=A0A7I8VMS3_9ANNE|nr:DgyrCDS6346 [Dimorphilus gyrociliatus]